MEAVPCLASLTLSPARFFFATFALRCPFACYFFFEYMYLSLFVNLPPVPFFKLCGATAAGSAPNHGAVLSGLSVEQRSVETK